MGLFGALFAGVSGLDSQSNKIGIISNNISNVNTVGFKQSQAAFDTLVVPSGTTSFSPGGVIGNTQGLVDQQGLLEATSSGTDAAITGNGFFVVNTEADGTGTQLLTRSGSFTQDADGNFVNADGYFLQGVSLAGVTSAITSINQSQLTTVNVNQDATGAANATTTMGVAGNFNAAQKAILGSGEIINLTSDATNSTNTASDIIVPTTANGIVAGDSFSVTSVNAGATDVFTYGGFATGRSVLANIGTAQASAGTNEGDNGTLLDSETAVAGAKITNNGVNATVTVTVANGADYAVGGHISISGASTINGINPNGEWVVTGVTGNNITFTTGVTGTGGAANSSSTTFNVSNRTSAQFTGNVLNATATGGDLLSPLTASSFTSAALSFKVETTGTGGGTTSTFTYNADPNPDEGQFNSLTSLVTAINDSSNGTLTANVQNGQLYISATDANQGLSFTNGDAAGNGLSGTSALSGIDWTQELGLNNSSANVQPAGTDVNRFNTLNGLANLINSGSSSISSRLIATVNNATGTGATLSINEADPTSKITFTDGNITSLPNPTPNTGSSLLQEFGFQATGGGALTQVTGHTNEYTTTLGVTYSAASATTDMSSGAVAPQYTKDITIYDALGNAHTVALNAAKLSTNTWAVELTVVPASAVSTPTGDGQIASGIVTFNTDGTLASVTAQQGTGDSLASTINVNWTQTGPNAVGAAANAITLSMAGLVQSAGTFDSTVTQNGSPTGQLTGVTINAQGFVVETFSNGQTKEAYQIPLANVNNPDGLESVSGDSYQSTLSSGTISYNVVGQGGTGTLTPSALEQSNVDLSTQLTDLIVAQQAYGANSKLLTVADTLLQELDQIIQ